MTAKTAANTAKNARAPRSNPAKKAAAVAKTAAQLEMEAKLKVAISYQARQLEHIKAALKAGQNAQSQVVIKVTDTGDMGVKMQGMRTDSVRAKAEKTVNAQNVFTVVNSQNRQQESMVRYLWAIRNSAHVDVLTALEPMAQGWAIVKAAMPDSAFTDHKGIKRASFDYLVSEAMRVTVWKK